MQYKLDWSGIEPETFRMRSERDTPTPSALGYAALQRAHHISRLKL